jgi:hypothetical protein
MGTSAAKGAKGYEEWHWGIPYKQKVEWNDPDLPDGDLIECGRLCELHIREPGQRKDTIIKLARKEANGSHLCFDPSHPNQRLYILSHPEFREKMKKKYRQNSQYVGGTKYREMPLVDLAERVGGHHADGDYPDLEAAPLGVLTHVVYATEKKGDGFSFYIHKMGEETGLRPCLAIDARGRMWVVGGAYKSPTPGITN